MDENEEEIEEEIGEEMENIFESMEDLAKKIKVYRDEEVQEKMKDMEEKINEIKSDLSEYKELLQEKSDDDVATDFTQRTIGFLITMLLAKVKPEDREDLCRDFLEFSGILSEDMEEVDRIEELSKRGIL